jgi:subtilisin family serine protease
VWAESCILERNTRAAAIFFHESPESTNLFKMRPIAFICMLTTLALASPGTWAQISVPDVQLPRVPTLPLPADVDGTLSGVAATLDAQRLLDLRKLRLRTLVRRHRDVLEADPNGAPVVRSEVVAFAPTDSALELARSAGFSVRRERVLEGLDAKLLVLEAPKGVSTHRALKRLRKLDPEGAYDFNHVYETTGEIIATQDPAIGARGRAADARTTNARVGLIDGGVDVTHPALAGVPIEQRGCGGVPIASAHGTAVASLLAGRDERFAGAAPGAALAVVDVYCGAPTGGAVDSIAEAFAWMARARVPVINVSLVGPPNRTLESVVRLVLARGHIVVAAVGNDGPAAPPLYPAAYAGVIAVTGVDARRRALLEAGRGRHVDFAARGADMSAAATPNAYAAVRGTSFAAPIVSGLLATRLPAPDLAVAHRALEWLLGEAVDLGSRGRDIIFGDGLVGEAARH